MVGLVFVDFRRQATSALMHPATLAALGMLLVNDLLFKAMWPGAWVPGKLSDLAWMVFAPPLLAYVLSFATLGRQQAQRGAFLAAYAGLPLLYAAFNTFAPVHDVILRVLGIVGGDGPRSPLDPTDSIVIPFAMAAALWVWRRPPMEPESVRARLVLLAATAAALASVASSYLTDWGFGVVGRTPSGALGTYSHASGMFESTDGGLTWIRTGDDHVPMEIQDWAELQVVDPSGGVFIVDGVYAQIVRERPERESSERERMSLTRGPDNRLTVYGASASREVVYSYEYLQTDGNRWQQALDKRGIRDREITTRPRWLFYDDQSGNLIVAMGLQGVVVVAPDGTSTRVAVGPYSPTDFSFGGKVRTFFSSLLFWGEPFFATGIAFLLTISFAALALSIPSDSRHIALAAALSAVLAITHGVYPYASPNVGIDEGDLLLILPFIFTGFGLLPLLLLAVALVRARPSPRELLTLVMASVGMLMLVLLGALVLFETGTTIANFVAVGLVGLASLGIWLHRKRTQRRNDARSGADAASMP